MAIKVTGGTVVKGRNVTAVNKATGKSTVYNARGQSSVSAAPSKKSPFEASLAPNMSTEAGPVVAPPPSDSASSKTPILSTPGSQAAGSSFANTIQEQIANMRIMSQNTDPNFRYDINANQVDAQGNLINNAPVDSALQQELAYLKGGVEGALAASTMNAYIAVPALTGKLGQIVNKMGGGSRIGRVAPEAFDWSAGSSFANNPVTERAVTSAVGKLVNQMKKPKVLAPLIIGGITSVIMTHAWDGHLTFDNLIGGYDILIKDAIRNGNFDDAQLAIDGLTETTDRSLLDKIISWIPGINVAETTLNDGIKQGSLAADVYQDMLNNAKNNADSTGSGGFFDYNDYLAKKSAFEEEQRVANEDYWNSVQENWIRAKNEQRAADEKYWAEQLKKRAAYEDEQRRLNQEYWEEYMKKWSEMKEATTPSNLKFGLL